MSFAKNFLERTRARTYSESSDGGDVFKLDGETSSCSPATGTSYDVDGKFSYTKVRTDGLPMAKAQTTVDENGKFSYYSSELRPVPPGWYDIDKTKHRVPLGWYQMSSSCPK